MRFVCLLYAATATQAQTILLTQPQQLHQQILLQAVVQLRFQDRDPDVDFQNVFFC